MPYASILDFDLLFMSKVLLPKIESNELHLKGGHLGILNVYASNMVGERCAMWNDIFQFLLMNCRWITTSNFNMVDNSLDK